MPGSYAGAADVQGRMVRVPAGLPNALKPEDVDAIIAEIEGEINLVLASRNVAVPVAAPSWFVARLRSLTCDGSAAIAMKSVFPESQGPGTSPAYAYYETRYRQGLLQLQRMILPSTIVATSATLTPSTYFTKYPIEPPELEPNEKGLFDVDKVL